MGFIAVAAPVGLLFLFIFVLLPAMMKLKRGYLEKALVDHEAHTGERLELEKVGIPPLRLWLHNRKGDTWGVARLPDGSRRWVRLRSSIFSSGPSLTFFDA